MTYTNDNSRIYRFRNSYTIDMLLEELSCCKILSVTGNGIGIAKSFLQKKYNPV